MLRFLFILFSSITIILVGGVIFLGTEGILLAQIALLGVFFVSLVSLVPNYKLSLRFAKWLEEKGKARIENPKKLFWMAVGILILPIVLLIFWGTLASACCTHSPKPTRPVRPSRPEKIIRRPCKPLKPTRNGKAKTYFPSDPCFVLYNLNQVIEEGSEKNPAEVLQNLLVSDLIQTFSYEELEAAISEATETYGEIESFNFPKEFVVQGDWAEAVLEITTTKGKQLKFLVIFHKEGGAWKVFATEEI